MNKREQEISRQIEAAHQKKVNRVIMWIGIIGALGFVFFLTHMCSTIEGSKINTASDLKGTTWQHTSQSNGGRWYKLQINKDGSYDAWVSMPSQGEWSNHNNGKCRISEEWDDITGKKVLIVNLDNSISGVWYLVVEKGESYPSATFKDDLHNYGLSAEQTSKNPWK